MGRGSHRRLITGQFIEAFDLPARHTSLPPSAARIGDALRPSARQKSTTDDAQGLTCRSPPLHRPANTRVIPLSAPHPIHLTE
jgi:hypothetical protein